MDSLNLLLEEGSTYCQIIWSVEGPLLCGCSAGLELRPVEAHHTHDEVLLR